MIQGMWELNVRRRPPLKGDKRGDLRMLHSLLMVLVAVVISVLGQLSLKAGVTQVGAIGSASAPVQTFLRMCTTPLIIVGLGLYVLGAAVWLVVLSRLDLSYAYPLLALNFVLIPLASWILLGEKISLLRWLGILVICLGLSIVLRS